MQNTTFKILDEMGFNVGLQFGLELTKILPIKETVQTAGTRLLALARDLRKAGSDLLVEDDLAELIGRVKIKPDFEAEFRGEVARQGVLTLPGVTEFQLAYGAGPTVMNALRDRRYMSAVIQLSLLSAFHPREQLAGMIANTMTQRSEAGIPDAYPDPGFPALVGTLASIAEQTSTFQWCSLAEKVEKALGQGLTGYIYHSDNVRVTPSLLAGIFDAFVAVQSLPEDRQIEVSNQTGAITIVTWAHFVLGLDVVVVSNISEKVHFGEGSHSQVIIQWNAGLANTELLRDPELRLLDADASVILRSYQDEDLHDVIRAQDRHVLLGWGAMSLRRSLNNQFLIAEESPIYQDLATSATARALFYRAKAKRFIPDDFTSTKNHQHLLNSRVSLEAWRFLRAAKILFHPREIEIDSVNAHLSFLETSEAHMTVLPTSCSVHLKHFNEGEERTSAAQDLNGVVWGLARIILLLAHVSNLEESIDVPLLSEVYDVEYGKFMRSLNKPPYDEVRLSQSDIFRNMAMMISDDQKVLKSMKTFYGHDSRDDETSREVWLWSDYGWSIYFDTVGDKDPADVRPELIHIKRGVPTHVQTGERRRILVDGRALGRGSPRGGYSLVNATKFIPQSVGTVKKRRELWSRGLDNFALTIDCEIAPTPFHGYEFVSPTQTESLKQFEDVQRRDR